MDGIHIGTSGWSPDTYRRWYEDASADFVFAVNRYAHSPDDAVRLARRLGIGSGADIANHERRRSA